MAKVANDFLLILCSYLKLHSYAFILVEISEADPLKNLDVLTDV